MVFDASCCVTGILSVTFDTCYRPSACYLFNNSEIELQIEMGHIDNSSNPAAGRIGTFDICYLFNRPYWYKAVLDDVGFTPAEAEV